LTAGASAYLFAVVSAPSERAPRVSLPRSLGALALSVALPLASGALSGLATDPGFYRQLDRPDWAPPGEVFGPVWSVLYVLMGLAAFWVWRVAGWQAARVALSLYGAQLALNVAWSPIFFGLRLIGPAFIELTLLLLVLVATVVAFARHSRGAALLLVPYLGWVGFAGALNFAIWRLNA
jgi:translocator protein